MLSLAVAMFAANAVAAFGAPSSDDVAKFGGCYRISMSPWTPALRRELRDDIAVPTAIRLTANPSTWPPGLAIEAITEAPNSLRRDAFWMVDRDQVELDWTTGFTGLSMNLRSTAKGLGGTAKTFSDDGTYHETANVDAERIPCAQSSGASR